MHLSHARLWLSLCSGSGWSWRVWTWRTERFQGRAEPLTSSNKTEWILISGKICFHQQWKAARRTPHDFSFSYSFDRGEDVLMFLSAHWKCERHLKLGIHWGLCHWWPSPQLCAVRICNLCSLPSFIRTWRTSVLPGLTKRNVHPFFTGSGALIEVCESVEILGLSRKIQLNIICIGMEMSLVLFSWMMMWVKLSKYEQIYTCGWTF